VEERLTEMYSPHWLRSTARKTGLVKRERKIDPVYLFWTFALSISMQTQRTLASLKRGYEERAGISVAMSSFYERFSPELVRY
jgi:putative transposase